MKTELIRLLEIFVKSRVKYNYLIFKVRIITAKATVSNKANISRVVGFIKLETLRAGKKDLSRAHK